MQSFPSCMQLQINCSASLANLASVELNRKAMLEDGCIKLVLENMSKFMSSAAFQAEVCATLANLACHETNAKYIVQYGGCNLIIKGMRTHLKKVDLQVQAFHALASLGKPGREVLERESFADVLMNSLQTHSKELELVTGTQLHVTILEMYHVCNHYVDFSCLACYRFTCKFGFEYKQI